MYFILIIEYFIAKALLQNEKLISIAARTCE